MPTLVPTQRRPLRDADGFGGLVPVAAVAERGETLVAVLAVEHHAEGFALPVLVLTAAPGLVQWSPRVGLTARDDRGGSYAASVAGSQSALGTLVCTAWLEPALPPEARRLELVVDALARVSPARGGGTGVARPLAGGPWTLAIELVPERTAAELPPPPGRAPEAPEPGSTPARSFAGFRDIVPVGQARLAGGAAVCLWALERYAERAVLTVAVLGSGDDEIPPLAGGQGRVEAWDDRGGAYAVTPLGGVAGSGWSETVLELVPAIDPRARALGVRLADLPGGRETTLDGPFSFGLALPPPPA
jgi:hypothetical protein